MQVILDYGAQKVKIVGTPPPLEFFNLDPPLLTSIVFILFQYYDLIKSVDVIKSYQVLWQRTGEEGTCGGARYQDAEAQCQTRAEARKWAQICAEEANSPAWSSQEEAPLECPKQSG